MVCPSCGRQVAGTEACRFCGANVKNGVTLSPESVPLAGGGTSPGTVDDSFRQKHDATTSLILGIVSFATLPVVFAFSYVFANLPVIFVYFKADLPADVFAVLFATAIFGGMLALVLGRRANQAVRRIEGGISGNDRAKRGMVLGAVGAGIWSLVRHSYLLPHSRLEGGVSAVGSLRTISTAAITYSSQYGHGFPLRLSFLAPPKLGRLVGSTWKYDDPNDQAAGLIDAVSAAGNKSGYRFYYLAGPVDSQGVVQSYTVHADPLQPSAEHPYYFTDQTGVVRKQLWREANASSPPVD